MNARRVIVASISLIASAGLATTCAPQRVFASEYSGVVTLEEMEEEVAMYDEETGEFFFVKDQKTADYCTENYGWSQVTKESTNTGIPDYIKRANAVVGDATDNIQQSKQEDVMDADVDKESEAEVQSSSSSDLESSGGTDEAAEADVQDDAVSDLSANKSEHGPFASMDDEAKSALLSAAQRDDEEDRYIEIYATATNVTLDSDTWNALCNIGNAFSVRIVGPKENALWRYDFPSSSLNKSDNDIELRLAAVTEDDVSTYLSFLKTQELPGEIVFTYYRVSENASYELRSSSGSKIASAIGDADKSVSFELTDLDNYHLVNTDLEKQQATSDRNVIGVVKTHKIGVIAAVIVVIGAVTSISVLAVTKKKKRKRR